MKTNQSGRSKNNGADQTVNFVIIPIDCPVPKQFKSDTYCVPPLCINNIWRWLQDVTAYRIRLNSEVKCCQHKLIGPNTNKSHLCSKNMIPNSQLPEELHFYCYCANQLSLSPYSLSAESTCAQITIFSALATPETSTFIHLMFIPHEYKLPI